MDTIILPLASDYHLHMRQGSMLRRIAAYSRARCGRVLVMPNTKPPITTASQLRSYRRVLEKYLSPTEVLLTIKLLPSTTPAMIREAKEAGAVACKVYPEGVTTNSEDGLDADYFATFYATNIVGHVSQGKWLHEKKVIPFLHVLDAMEENDMVLCLHGEMPGKISALDRERRFLDFVDVVVRRYPRLRVVLEHITTADAVNAVSAWQYIPSVRPCRIAATVTPHHIYYNLNSLLEGDNGKLHPWCFCKPVAKETPHQEAIQRAVLSGTQCFFLGSDSAPHSRKTKECAECCAGIWNAPVLVESLIDFFEANHALEKLPGFMANHGDSFYGLPPIERTRKYTRSPWKVPDYIAGMKPFLSGKVLNWQG